MTTSRAWPVRTATRERNREALLAAAGELLAEHGYAGCSLGGIARRAQLSTGAVYSNFGSKAELFLELLQGTSRLPDLEADQAHAPSMAGVLEAFGRRWAAVVNEPSARANLELSYELQLAALREPAVLARVAQAQHDDAASLATQLGAAAGRRAEALPLPSLELAQTLIAGLQGLTEQALLLGTPVDPDRFAAVARRLLAA